MINSYRDQQNPCTFCLEDSDNKNKEYLEFSLCGNETTLFVREVSEEDFTKPKENEIYAEEVSEPTGTNKSLGSQKLSITLPSTSEKSRSKFGGEKCASHIRQLNALNTKRWSGNTYFEEEIRKLREQQYEKELRQGIKMRKLWRSFQKSILKDTKQDIVRSSGPEWWQEPSRKQIVLASTLREVIKADYEEDVTGRTRQWMLDLGVTSRLSPKQVRRCMKRSLLEPVDFLLESHSLMVKSQLNVKKKGELHRPFGVDERLLLSAVCVLHLPTLLTMLHYMLPPPKPYSTDKRILELLYGDLDDETIRYMTPYMEPLPFRNKIEFEDWAFGKICNSLLPILLQKDETGRTKIKSVVPEKLTTDLKNSFSMGSQAQSQTNCFSVYSAGSITLLLNYCLSKRHASDSLRVNLDEESVSARRRTFVRRLTALGKFHGHSKHVEQSSKGDSTNPVQVSLKSGDSHSTIKKEKTSPLIQEYAEESNWANQLAQEEPRQPTLAKDNNYPYYSYDVSQSYGDDNLYYQHPNQEQTYPKHDNNFTESKGKKPDVDNIKAFSKIAIEPTEETHSEMGESMNGSQKEQEDRESLHQQLKQFWEEIEALTDKEQLHEAIKVLAGMGDPLAQLPKVHKLPAIQRWLELRRGRNRILSRNTKEELLKRSRGMWKSQHFAYSTKAPKVDITKKEERLLTWDKKKWLETGVRKETQNYFSRIKQEKVDNARCFFPTMLNHYDYGSKLNRNFRDVYYTYLPAREADTLVYRPWKPQETTNSKS